MKVELQCGDTIAIPNGCKATIKDGEVIIEKEFKDGDILVAAVNEERYNAFIYKSTDKNGFHSYYVGLDVCKQISISDSPSNRWSNDSLFYATEEEKQELFDKMKEQGLRWNAEEKKVEKIRWRASPDERYYCISNLLACLSDIEESHIYDKERWEMGNYFRTSEQAEEAASRVKETLRKYHEEIGE